MKWREETIDDDLMDLIQRLADHQMDQIVADMEDSEEHVFSQDFGNRMEKLIQDASLKAKRKARGRIILKRSLALAASLVVIFFIALGPEKVAAVAKQIQMTFVGHFSDHDEYRFKVTQDYDVEDLPPFEVPAYVPEGFELVDSYDYDRDFCGVRYENQSGDFYAYRRKVPDNMTMGINNEDVEIEYKTINGLQMMVRRSTRDQFYNFLWDKELFFYQLSGTLPEEEFLKIIDSLPEY